MWLKNNIYGESVFTSELSTHKEKKILRIILFLSYKLSTDFYNIFV